MEAFNLMEEDPDCPLLPDDKVSFAQLEQLFLLQRNILEGVALASSYEAVLIELCQMAEAMVPNSLASIMMLDKQRKCLNVLVAPSIPPEGIQLLNGLVPGPHAGSCGNTIYRQKPTFVTNILTDEKWRNLKHVAEDFGLGACWSMPVRVADGEIIGTFALTSFEAGAPNAFQRRVLDTCAYIVSIVQRRMQSESKLAYLAYHDTLTGLHNRDFLQKTVNELIVQAKPFSLLMFGLDRFKAINDSHGHDVGDAVLIAISQRLQLATEDLASLYRISGDEFILLVEDLDDMAALQQACQRLMDVYQIPVKASDLQFYLSGSIGISQFNPMQPSSFYTLVKQADLAMYESKAKGGKTSTLYSPEMSIKVEDTLALESDIHNAIQNKEFEVYYQPILNAKTQVIENLEALIRWNHPVKGMISPINFIALAEEIGVIHTISKLVVENVLEDLEVWEAQGLADVRVAINLSGREFNRLEVNELLAPILDRDRAKQIEFELTEGYLMSHAASVLELLDTIRGAGISISMDDFGTGYSSLSYLKRFPIDKLKIDQSLVRDMPHDKSDQAIIKAVIALAHSLGLKVVAEGVETTAHHELLMLENVDLLQGYLYSKPVPRQVITALLQDLPVKYP